MGVRDAVILGLEGLRLGGRSLAHLGRGWARYEGEAEAVCAQIAEACWNGTWFQAGQDHLDQFWIRDLAIALEGLIDLGLAEQARANLRWALEVYARAGRVTTSIFLGGRAIDIFTYSADSLPFLLYALERLEMVEERRARGELLRAEAARYRARLFDDRGAVRDDEMFSITKDTTDFPGSAAIHAMAAWCAELVARSEVIPPFEGLTDLPALLIERCWTGEAFRNDVHCEPAIVSADANHWPFWCGLVPEAQRLDMLRSSVAAVRAEGLTEPFPLRYHSRRFAEREHPIQRLFLPNYQGDSIWTFFSPAWMELAFEVDPEATRREARATEAWLAEHKTWVEVFDPAGAKPLKGRFGHGSDHGMLWAANWPRVRRRILGGAP